MARCFPEFFPGGEWGEEQVFTSLVELPDPWLVIYDVAFVEKHAGRPAVDGQADFVLLHPTHGLLVLEVKGGTIVADDGVWTSTNNRGTWTIKDPYQQAVRNKFALRDLVEERTGLSVYASHGVIFPSTHERTAIGLQPDEITWYAADLESPERAIRRLIDYAAPPIQSLTASQLKLIADRLAPTVVVRTKLSDLTHAAATKQVQLTRQQSRILDATRLHDRVWIEGGAGTGKTLLAVERARQLSSEGQTVLLLCFNQPLSRHLQSQVDGDSRILADSFHGFAADRIGARPGDIEPEEWFEFVVPERLLGACAESGETWDAVIIDEGQDFAGEWLEVLEQLLDGDGPLLFFADVNQNLFRPAGMAGLPAHPLVLDVNCRNTPEISARSSAPLGLAPEVLLEPSGIEPQFHVVDVEASASEILRKELHRLIVDEGISPTEVTVLSPSRSFIDSAQGSRVGRWDLVTVEAAGTGIVCETVQRFKGLESVAVVLVFIPGAPIDPKLAYVGMSRACSVLTVVGNAAAAESAAWALG